MSRSRSRSRAGMRAVVVSMSITLVTGCSQDPEGLVSQMSRAYRDAERYRDDGRVTIKYRRGEVEVDHAQPFRVAFERPDRLRIECYDAMVVADGTTLRAAVGSVPGQVLTQPVRSPVALDQLFADDCLRATLSEGEAGCPTQLALLLADDTPDLIMAEAVGRPRLAGVEEVEGRRCTKLEIDKPDGTLTLWIDRESRLLRRLSLPTAAYAAFLERQIGPVSGVRVVAEFTAASFTEPLPKEAFAFESPKTAREVAALEPVGSPDPPSEIIGRPAPPFQLPSAGGRPVTKEGLAGRLAVLEFFAVDGGTKAGTTPAIAEAVAAIRERDSVAVEHYAVSLDDAALSDEAVVEAAREAGCTAPVVRDPRGVAAGALDVASLPAVVVLAPDGTVADLQCGRHPAIGDDVREIAGLVASGRSTVEHVRRRFERRLAAYREAIDEASGEGETAAEQVISPKRQPDRFKLVRAWRASDIAMPGNVVRVDPSAVDVGGRPRLIVLDGWRSVVELACDGTEIARHDLPLPPDAEIGFLRTAIDSSGSRWWLGAALGASRLFVFDDRWKLRATCAASSGDDPSAKIGAAEFIGRDGGLAIAIGLLDDAGVHAFSLEGERLWSDRSIGTVRGMAADASAEPPRLRGVVCVDGRGRLVRVHADGTKEEPREVADWRIRSLFGGPVGTTDSTDPAWSHLAIAGLAPGRTSLVGIAADGSPRWDRPLPDGVNRDAHFEPVAWADLLGSLRRQWLVAAADGSVLVLWDDGGLVDRYCHGEPIVGIAGFTLEGRGHILIATRSVVQALRMEDIALD